MKRTMPLRIQQYYNKKNISTNFQTNNFTISIVYFANLFVNPVHGHQLIIEQMTDLVHTGLLSQISHIHIVLSVPSSYNTTFLTIKLTYMLGQKVVFHKNNEDCYEYPGIQLVYSLANQNHSSTHYILYFHSKSMSRYKGVREEFEKSLHSTVIAPWKHVLSIFNNHPSIDKIGWSASEYGFMWYNYWWVRSSYIVKVESPVKTSRRHYYEDWLCRVLLDKNGNNDPNRPEKCFQLNLYRHSDSNCWSLSYKKNNIGHGYDYIKAPPELLYKK